MKENPYNYEGPLEPWVDSLVCVPRQGDMNRLLQSLIMDEYCAVLGPGKIGKTTLLRQFQADRLLNAHFVYFDFKNSQSDEDGFYKWLMDK
jgi:predicted AAA+ superfamily ATPase